MNRFVPAQNLISPLHEEIRSAWKNDPGAIVEWRKKGELSFLGNGLPTTKVEAWKYTDITTLKNKTYVYGPAAAGKSARLKDGSLIPERASRISLVFINGVFSEQHSEMAVPENIYVKSLRAALDSGDASMLELIGRTEKDSDPMTDLNSAYLNEGVLVRIPENLSPGIPVHIIHVSIPEVSGVMFHPRNLIVAGKGSRIDIIEEYTGSGKTEYLTNTVTEIIMEDGSEVNHYKLQTESPSSTHIGSLNVIQGRDTKFSSYLGSFGGSLARNNITVSMNGTGSACDIAGLYYLKGSQHLDNHSEIRHLSPSCTSSENFNGVLDDGSRAVFDGKVYVGRDSVGTDSSQSSRSLLLSDSASVDAKPTLEIYADDVKCSHSASVGQPDLDAMVYLRSRGISSEAAMKMLTAGFLNEILDRFSNAFISGKIDKILQSEMKG